MIRTTRFYDAYRYERYGRKIYTVVFYGADVAVAETSIECGAIQYEEVENVLLGQQDGDKDAALSAQSLEKCSHSL